MMWLLGYRSMRMRNICNLSKELLTILVAVLTLGPPSAFANESSEVPLGGIIREANLLGLNGPSRNLSAYRGRPLIINVWASWCGPCRQEMASLERLAWLVSNARFAIIGISTDDDADKAKALLTSTHATISHFIDRHLVIEDMLGARQLPLTLLIDANGRVLEKIYGARQWDSEDSQRLINNTFAGSHQIPAQSQDGAPNEPDRMGTR